MIKIIKLMIIINDNNNDNKQKGIPIPQVFEIWF